MATLLIAAGRLTRAAFGGRAGRDKDEHRRVFRDFAAGLGAVLAPRRSAARVRAVAS